MLTLYRRHHLKGKKEPNGCPHKADRYYRRCQCPMWAEGTIGNKPGRNLYIRYSLKTRSWAKGKEIADRWEASQARPDRTSRITLTEAIKQYMTECRTRNLSAMTLKNRGHLLTRFGVWCASHHLRDIDAVTTKDLREWFTAGKKQASTRQEERRVLQQFFNFAIRERWITENPTKNIGKLVVRRSQTDYLNTQEFANLLGAINDPIVYALTLLMRWSGLRISDALNLEQKSLDSDGILLLYQRKTGQPISIPLPDAVIKVLNSLPGTGSKFFEVKAAYSDHYRRELRAASQLAGIKHTHPHMLRDTFAIQLLLAGVPLDQVSKALGHTSIKTTEAHYAPWIKGRQDQLNLNIRRAWSQTEKSPADIE